MLYEVITDGGGCGKSPGRRLRPGDEFLPVAGHVGSHFPLEGGRVGGGDGRRHEGRGREPGHGPHRGVHGQGAAGGGDDVVVV